MTVQRKILILMAVALTAAACGAWLVTSPNREREYVAAAQEAMIEDLMRGIQEAEYAVELPEIDNTEEIDEVEETNGGHYIEENTYLEYEIVDYEAVLYTPEAMYEPLPVYEPLPDNAFPNTIAGIGILMVEAIDLRLPIAEGIEYATLRIAPGRVPQTAQVGEIGNAVIAGHRNYTFGEMFNRLDEIELGDILHYQARNGEMMEFEVFEIAVIEPHDQIAFIQPVNDSIITLYTCTPIRVASHRLIIRAQRIS